MIKYTDCSSKVMTEKNESIRYYSCIFSDVFLVSPDVDAVTLEKRIFFVVEFIFFRKLVYVILTKIYFANVF